MGEAGGEGPFYLSSLTLSIHHHIPPGKDGFIRLSLLGTMTPNFPLPNSSTQPSYLFSFLEVPHLPFLKKNYPRRTPKDDIGHVGNYFPQDNLECQCIGFYLVKCWFKACPSNVQYSRQRIGCVVCCVLPAGAVWQVPQPLLLSQFFSHLDKWAQCPLRANLHMPTAWRIPRLWNSIDKLLIKHN